MNSKKILFLLLGLSSLMFLGCDDEVLPDNGVELVVTVKGSLSGKVRPDLRVGAYASEQEAEDSKNRITSAVTNQQGEAILKNLTLGKTYWIRANTALRLTWTVESITINSTHNTMEITVL